MKKKNGIDEITEKMEKRERLVTGLIITIAILIGILVTFLLTGLVEYFF